LGPPVSGKPPPADVVEVLLEVGAWVVVVVVLDGCDEVVLVLLVVLVEGVVEVVDDVVDVLEVVLEEVDVVLEVLLVVELVVVVVPAVFTKTVPDIDMPWTTQ
jgi:hypothetical protein